MKRLDELVTAAVALAGGEAISRRARLWTQEGGRSCPKGYSDCSQAVYVDIGSGEYDFGEPDGPAHDDCFVDCGRPKL
jgi:hypothetical protein